MQPKQALILELRQKLGEMASPSLMTENREFLKCPTVSQGVPRGVISEITGLARTEWVLRLLKENPDLYVFWAEKSLSILPTALHQRGIDLEKVLLAETGDRLFQALRKALKSKLFDCVVLPGAIEEIKMLKALQLFARESNACVFFLSKLPKNAWAIPFQLQADWEDSEAQEITVTVLKSKFSQALPQVLHGENA